MTRPVGFLFPAGGVDFVVHRRAADAEVLGLGRAFAGRLQDNKTGGSSIHFRSLRSRIMRIASLTYIL